MSFLNWGPGFINRKSGNQSSGWGDEEYVNSQAHTRCNSKETHQLPGSVISIQPPGRKTRYASMMIDFQRSFVAIA